MDQVSQVREKTDLVSLISEYIPLKKMGRNFKANCPFHNEKTPSFIVSPERQIWHCFGCQKGGDAFTFLMEYESLEFPEALRILAKKAGVDFVESSSWQGGISSKKEKIYKLNSIACQFYHYLLTEHNAGKPALKYLIEKRGVNKSLIDTFKIGFAPRMGNALVTFLISKKKFEREDLIDAGLCSFKGKELYDFFANRIIFPLFDHRSNIMGFSGRTLQESFSSKYVNTRETLVYHKGDVFFGLNLAKDEIKKENQVFIVEGEFDVISCFSQGVKNIIAVKGSAITENQVNLISRFAQKVTLCFDMDDAGGEAIKRSVPVLEKKGLTTTVITNLNGKDPDEAVKKNPADFKKALKSDVGVYDFLLEKAISKFDKKTIEGKKKIAEETLPFFAEIENEIVKEHFLKKVAVELETSYESIEKEAQRIKRKEVLSTLNKTQTSVKRTRKEVLEEYLLALVFQHESPKTIFKSLENILSDILTGDSAQQKILALYFESCKNSQNFTPKNFIKELPTELLGAYDKSFLFPLTKFADENYYEEELEKVSEELKIILLKIKIKKISDLIKEREGNQMKEKEEELENLKKEFSKLLLSFKKSQSPNQ